MLLGDSDFLDFYIIFIKEMFYVVGVRGLFPCKCAVHNLIIVKKYPAPSFNHMVEQLNQFIFFLFPLLGE